ncbi:MAG: chromosome segregation protein SMC [Proteobacteria bacterium]|nr:chromosome segregation protein SMC [Pseudomonadota bacterium]
MKLKSLEISGFKSFIDKANIEFPAGVCAIVGPNGCGKSNIVDALKWVMGEQSVKQLRGKSMEDVIFAGANGKPQLNMAEVSLTLANDNGSAPEELKDFAEIMLTRRLYRSGESEYYLNKRPCRLKDIHNIFLGSGLGPRSYAVIQQGNIGAIIDAGPQERRVFIEEAAGVTRYNSRKNEALRKVEATNQNLLRVTDIISEINRQMSVLKRQARKAEIYKNLQDRIKKLDTHITIYYFDEYTRLIDETDKILENLRDADSGHISKLQQLDAIVEDIKFKLSQKNQEISEQKSSVFEIQRNTDRLENDLLHLRDNEKRLITEVSELESARTVLVERNEKILSEISNVESQTVSVKDEITNTYDKLEAERDASLNSRNRLAELTRELDACKTNLMNLIAHEARYKNIYQNASTNKENLKRRLKRADEEYALATKNVSEISATESKAKEDLELYRQKIDEIVEEESGIKQQLEEKSKLLGAKIKTVQNLDMERNKLRSAYTTLKKMEDNFEWYKDGVKAIMTHCRGGEGLESTVPGVVTELMADIIEPEPSYETAVEAALGEYLQYVVVEDQNTCRSHIEYLQENRAGRSGFVPVSSIKQLQCEHYKKPDSSKLLLNHVFVKPGFEKTVETLLGHVVVAQDINEALHIFNSNGAFQAVVTKNGEMISHNGTVAGGSSDSFSGILAKKNEIKELEKQISGIEHNIEEARVVQKALESELKSAEIAMQKLKEREHRARQDENEAEKFLYKTSEELKHAKRHYEIVQLEQEQLMGEESDIDEEIKKYNEALLKVENEVSHAREEVNMISGKIETASAELADYDKKIVDLKLNLTSLNAKFENGNNSLNRLKEFHHDGIRQMETAERDIVEKANKIETSKQKIAENENTLSGMYEKAQILGKALKNNEDDYNTIDVRQKEHDELITSVKNEREQTLEKLRLLENEQSQRRIQTENIAKRFEDRYQIILYEARTDCESLEDISSSTVKEMEEELEQNKRKSGDFTDVNLGAIKEYEELEERFNFLNKQREDLVKAIEDLHKVIKKINKISQERFLETFNEVNKKIGEVFPSLFEGGSASLILTEPDKPLETGVEYMIHPPGKKLTRMSLMSGGEKALSAIAFIFAIFLLKPASFCIMDEIDAPLDESNVYRFNNLLKIIGEKSQIVMITHNKRSMEFADMLFGITMEHMGVSKIVSVNLERRDAIINQN